MSSLRQFLEELLQTSSGPNAQVERTAALDHPDSTFGQLLGSSLVTRPGVVGSSDRLPVTRCFYLREATSPLLEAMLNTVHEFRAERLGRAAGSSQA